MRWPSGRWPSLGQDFKAIVGDEPDAALGNGGLGRLAACFMESMATLGCPAYGYGIRYEHGLFRQRFEGGQQVETPEDWLSQRNPWEFDRPEATYIVGFKGHVETRDGREVWVPAETVKASAHDTPVVGWQGRWANTLRLWGPSPRRSSIWSASTAATIRPRPSPRRSRARSRACSIPTTRPIRARNCG